VHEERFLMGPTSLLLPNQHREITTGNKKVLGEMQTLRAGCSKAEPKNLAADPFPRGAGPPKFNQPEMVTTFTYKTSLVKIDTRSFELSW